MRLRFPQSLALEVVATSVEFGHVKVQLRVRRAWLPFLMASMIGGPWWWKPLAFAWAAWRFWVPPRAGLG